MNCPPIGGAAPPVTLSISKGRTACELSIYRIWFSLLRRDAHPNVGLPNASLEDAFLAQVITG